MNEISNVKENLLKLAHEWTVTENDGRIMKSWISIQNSFNSEQNVALFFIRFTENLFFSIPLSCKKKYWTRIIENTYSNRVQPRLTKRKDTKKTSNVSTHKKSIGVLESKIEYEAKIICKITELLNWVYEIWSNVPIESHKICCIFDAEFNRTLDLFSTFRFVSFTNDKMNVSNALCWPRHVPSYNAKQLLSPEFCVWNFA